MRILHFSAMTSPVNIGFSARINLDSTGIDAAIAEGKNKVQNKSGTWYLFRRSKSGRGNAIGDQYFAVNNLTEGEKYGESTRRILKQ